jgi:hypothetical protein
MKASRLQHLLERQRKHDFALIDNLTPDLAAALARLALASQAARNMNTPEAIDELDAAIAAVFGGDDADE